MITVMRVPDPRGEWIVDPDEARLMKKADANKGERGVYKLMLEGIDDDNDGAINEDGPGGVDLDRNWPHLFESGVLAAGIHQLSEPETRALADFVIARPNITACVVYGRHDNIVKPPKGKQRGPAGRAYRDLHPDDHKLYEHISKKYKKITGLKKSAGSKAHGAFYSWLYAQRGIPTFAASTWQPPEKEKKKPASQPSTQPTEKEKSDAESDEPAQPGATPADEPPDRETIMAGFRERFGNRQPTPQEAQAFFRGMRGGSVRVQARPGRGGRAGGRPSGRTGPSRGGGAGGGGGTPPKADGLAGRVQSSKTLEQWLEYSDEQRNGEGFVPWTEFDHPTLGKVEIGGLTPHFATTPPADQLDQIAEKQLEFVLALAGLLPQPGFGAPQVKNAGGGVWEVEIRIKNDGYLPTHSGIARHIRLPGWVVKPLIDKDRIIGGRPVERVANLPGSGRATVFRWLIRGDAGAALELRAYNRAYGELRTKVTLNETPLGEDN
jgi:hypothetical protein